MLRVIFNTAFLLAFLISLVGTRSVSGEENCSRIAYINGQEVLVDSSSSVRGDGLKFYLEKDPIAAEYFKTYKENTKPSLLNSSISGVGTAVILGGMLIGDSNNRGFLKRNTMLGVGLSLIVVNFLISTTRRYSNERNLEQAVNEYNKRNLPKIYFRPDDKDGGVGVQYKFSF